MNLLKALFLILDLWRPAFCKRSAFIRAKEHAIASLYAFNRKTITSMAIYLGRGQKLPIADYKFYSEYKWNVEDLFNPILQKAMEYCPADYVSVAADDTKIHKSGKKIPNASWHADHPENSIMTRRLLQKKYAEMKIFHGKQSLFSMVESGEKFDIKKLKMFFGEMELKGSFYVLLYWLLFHMYVEEKCNNIAGYMFSQDISRTLCLPYHRPSYQLSLHLRYSFLYLLGKSPYIICRCYPM